MELVVTCNICDEEITRIPGIHVQYPPDQEIEKAQKALSASIKHLEEKHTKDDLAAYLRGRGQGFWRTTLK